MSRDICSTCENEQQYESGVYCSRWNEARVLRASDNTIIQCKEYDDRRTKKAVLPL